MKSALFKTYGDSEHGLGHVYRSIALSIYFDSNNILSFFVIDEKTPNEFIKAMNSNKRQTIDLNTSGKYFDYLIYDMPFLDKAFFETINLFQFTKKIGLDFFNYEYKYIDLALNLFNHQNPETSTFDVKENIQYAILRDNILFKNPKHKLTLAKNMKHKTLITFGSADPKNNTCVVLDRISDDNQFIDIILGPLYNKDIELDKSIARFSKTEFNILRNVSNIEDYILSSDLVFCGGGATLLETIYLHKSAIVIPQTIEEFNFAKSLAMKNLCAVIDPNLSTQINISDFLSKTFTTIQIGMGKKLILNELMGSING